MKMDERKRLRIRNKTDLILGLVLAVHNTPECA